VVSPSVAHLSPTKTHPYSPSNPMSFVDDIDQEISSWIDEEEWWVHLIPISPFALSDFVPGTTSGRHRHLFPAPSSIILPQRKIKSHTLGLPRLQAKRGHFPPSLPAAPAHTPYHLTSIMISRAAPATRRWKELPRMAPPQSQPWQPLIYNRRQFAASGKAASPNSRTGPMTRSGMTTLD
jgi:hypothetical protein